MAKVALLIGVSEYKPGLNPLPAAVKDVAALERVLQDTEIGGFDEVKVLTNPDPQTMQYEIETLFTKRGKDDLAVLFFSGHGIKDDSNNLYFATAITEKNSKGNLIRSTAVPARFVHEVMNNCRAKRQAIILDCCFSGAFDPSLQSKDDGSVDVEGQFGAEGRVVLTSSSSTQYSFEQQGSELSLYTRYLVEGIETGAGDRDEDGRISIRELHDYATSRVQETAPNMTPKLITLKDMGFDIVVAKTKVTDPQLRYRRQVERYSSRGSISAIGRTILDRLQTQLGLPAEVAAAIEADVLRPYQERLENIQRYRQVLLEAIQQEYPLSAHVQSELEDLREILGLRQEDVDALKQDILAQSAQHSTDKRNNQSQELSQTELPQQPVAAKPSEQLRTSSTPKETHKSSQQSKTPEAEPVRTTASSFFHGKLKLLVGGGIVGSVLGLVLIVQSGILHFSHPPQTVTTPATNIIPAPDPTLRSSDGHTNLVSALSFSPDGKILVSGSWDSLNTKNQDSSVKVWNLSNGQLIYNLPASSWSVLAVAISPNSKILANGNGYGSPIETETLKLWNLDTGTLIRSIAASAKIGAVAFSPDGKTLISGTQDKTLNIKLWNVDDGQLRKTLSGHTDSVSSVAVTSDGKNLVSGSFDKTIRLWDLQTGTLIRTFSQPAGAVTCLAISRDNKFVVSGSSDKTIKLWDLQTGTLIRTFHGHSSVVTSVAISPNGQTLVSGGGGYDSPDKTIKVWNLNTGEVIHTLTDHTEAVTAIALSPDGEIIASGSEDTTVKLWSLSTGKLLRTF